MGSKKSKKNRKLEKKLQETEIDLNRRRFSKQLLGGIVATTIAGGSGLAWYFKDNWAFITDPVQFATNAEISKRGVPIGKKKDFLEYAKQNDKLAKAIEEKMSLEAKIQKTKRENLECLEWFTQQIGMPLDQKYVEGLRDYCEKAKDFLYDNLKGLANVDVEWTPLVTKDNYEKSWANKGFLADRKVRIVQRSILNKKSGKIHKAIQFEQNVGGVAHTSIFDDDYTEEKDPNWWILVTRGRLAINAPFSEIIPLSFRKESTRYLKMNDDPRWALSFGEAISERISYILSKRISRRLKIPNGERIAEENVAGAVKADIKYGLVPKAIRWLERNGIQEGYDLYKKNPLEFFVKVYNAKV